MKTRLFLLLLTCVGFLCPNVQAQNRVHPTEGQVLTHIHTRFRWKPIPNIIGKYFLQVVEDNGAPDPFTNNPAVVAMQIQGSDPRVVVKSGLEFGKDYAWRVLALVPPFPGIRTASPTHRFSTLELPDFAPDISITVPPGAGPTQPGLTLFNLRIGGNPPPGGLGFIIAVDEQGDIVWFYEYQSRRTSDLRQLEDGRYLWIMQSLVGVAGNEGTAPGRAVEMNLNGLITWLSPPDEVNSWVHHEASRLPNGNQLLLIYEPADFPGMTPSDWLGDRIIEMDRHTKEIVGNWSAFDDYSLGDWQAQLGPGGDWVHGNAAVYDESDGSVWYSARSLSRISKIDWTTKQVIFSFGEDFQSGDAPFGDNMFSFQHAPQVMSNGNLLLFDNGNTIEPLTDPRQSRAVEFSFDDPVNPTSASVAWEHNLVDEMGMPMYAPFLGDADRLPNGNTLIVAGPLVTVTEVDAASQMVWRMVVGNPFPLGAIYRAERIDELVKDTPGDVDDDWDIDMHDMAEFQNRYNGAATEFPSKLIDTNADGVLNESDFDHFFFWLTGPANFLGQFPS